MYKLERELIEKTLANKLYVALKYLYNELRGHSASADGVELYLVGGCVRDLLLGKEPKDYDLCTNLTPQEVIEKLSNSEGLKIIETGIKHGTVTVYNHDMNIGFEVTTYRIDAEYEDHRHPDTVTFTRSLEEDLKRRDLTINSFAYDFLNGEILMLDEKYIKDLELGVIRTVGNPEDRFKEDALRMMRAIRFSAQLGFSIEKETYLAIAKLAETIQYVSKERVRDEFTKILLSDGPQTLEYIYTTGLYNYVMPDLGKIVECTQHNKYHYTTVFHHTLDVIRRVPKEFNARWAALFHDMGKPYVKTTDAEGWEHYYEHQKDSQRIAEMYMDELKFSNEQKEVISKYVYYHDYPLSQVNDRKFKEMIVEIGEENFVNFLKLREADALAHNLSMSTNFAIDAVSICKDRYIKYLTEPEPLRIKDLAINGNDLKDIGLNGKEIGEALKLCLEKVLEKPELNTKEELLRLVR